MAVILIIDDSPTELHLFKGMLEKGGFETLVADSGEEGIRQAGASRPDCILMDVVMPGMNGFQATRKLTHDHHEGPGDGQNLGHAPGCSGIHRQTCWTKRTCCQDQLGDG